MNPNIWQQIEDAHCKAQDCLGCEVTYSFDNGDPAVQILVIFDEELLELPAGYQNPVVSNAITIGIKRSDINEPCHGDSILVPDSIYARPYNNRTFILEQLIDSNDPWYHCAVVCDPNG